MPPIKFSMVSINHIFEYYQGKIEIKDFSSDETLIRLDDIDSMDLIDFIIQIKEYKHKNVA